MRRSVSMVLVSAAALVCWCWLVVGGGMSGVSAAGPVQFRFPDPSSATWDYASVFGGTSAATGDQFMRSVTYVNSVYSCGRITSTDATFSNNASVVAAANTAGTNAAVLVKYDTGRCTSTSQLPFDVL